MTRFRWLLLLCLSLCTLAGAAPVTNITVPLVPGWNPVGLQCQRVTTLASNPAVAGVATYANGTYTYGTPTNGRQGLMVYATQATNLVYSGTDDGQGNFVDVQAGWQLVSFCTDQDLPSARLTATQNGQSVPLSTVVLPTFYLATPSQNVPVEVPAGTLKAGGAYWVFARASARLNLTAPVSVTSLTLTPSGPVTLSLFSTASFTATATFADGSRRDVTAEATWTSLGPSVAALIAPGVFKGLNEFTTTIQAVYGNQTSEAGLKVVTNNTPGPLPSPSPRAGAFTFPLVARSTTNFLRRFAASGAFLTPDPWSSTSLPGDVGIPAVDAAGSIYFPTNTGAGVLRVDGATGAVSPFATGFAAATLEACAFDASGNLYVSMVGPAQVVRVPPAGSPVTPIITTGLSTPVGLAFDRAGNLYVADANAGVNRVFSYDSTGALRTSWGVGGSVATGGTPLSLAFDSSGRLCVSENGPGQVSRISADGSSITPALTGVPGPSGLVIDENDNFYVLVTGGTVRQYDSAGTLLNGSFVTGLAGGLRGLALSPR